MKAAKATTFGRMKHGARSWRGALPAIVLIGVGLSGCVQVTAPNRPIEIVLTVNIRQEIVYRLNGAAQDTINNNAGIF